MVRYKSDFKIEGLEDIVSCDYESENDSGAYGTARIKARDFAIATMKKPDYSSSRISTEILNIVDSDNGRDARFNGQNYRVDVTKYELTYLINRKDVNKIYSENDKHQEEVITNIYAENDKHALEIAKSTTMKFSMQYPIDSKTGKTRAELIKMVNKDTNKNLSFRKNDYLEEISGPGKELARLDYMES